nr:unnamed protein product [Callosobruchus chinensis]
MILKTWVSFLTPLCPLFRIFLKLYHLRIECWVS